MFSRGPNLVTENENFRGPNVVTEKKAHVTELCARKRFQPDFAQCPTQSANRVGSTRVTENNGSCARKQKLLKQPTKTM